MMEQPESHSFPRYVILEHDYPELHWDFMLECGGVLRTWKLLSLPETCQKSLAEPLPDHRLMYLDYEGPVSKGRGFVKRWDWGSWKQTQSDSSSGNELIQIQGLLTGKKLQGEFIISQQSVNQLSIFEWFSEAESSK